MNNAIQFEHRASCSRGMHVGESSRDLCDRPSRTRDSSQRQLPTDHDYATSTREYQTDQSSLKPAPTAAGSVLERRQKQRQRQKLPHRFAGVDRVTPYQVSDRINKYQLRYFADGEDGCNLEAWKTLNGRWFG